MRVLLILLLTPLTAFAQSPNLTQEQRQFIELYAEAAKTRDEDKYLELIHPETRSCMSENLRRFVQDEFLTKAKHLQNMQQNFVRIEQIEMIEIDASIKKHYRDKAFLPVEPKYTLSAPIRQKPNKCGDVTGMLLAEIPVAFEKGQWFEVLPCGKNDLDEYLGKQLTARSIQQQRINESFENIASKTWEDLAPILTTNKTEAIKQLQATENLSRSKAIMLIQKYCEG